MNDSNKKQSSGKSSLDQLKEFTTVVADTGDFELLEQYAPRDATTNPSLILKAVQKDSYAEILDSVVESEKKRRKTGDTLVDQIIDQLLIRFGMEILKIIPGRVSTEVDAKLSFDSDATVRKAKDLIALYEENGIDRERILIKIASTREGIQAAEILQKNGIQCNMTLLFSLVQAVACAEVNATLVSPFVGRIYDWYKANTGQDYSASEDPGVLSVKRIFNYYKKFGHDTEVMGASFRNTGQIMELAGCDLLTISPDLLESLSKMEDKVEKKLNAEDALNEPMEKMEITEERFRWLLNEDAMATEKLAQGIRVFAADLKKLREIVLEKLKG